MTSKLDHRKKMTDVDTILENLSENTMDFKQAVDMARDQMIERTGKVVRLTAMQTALVHRDVKATSNTVTASIEKSQFEIESKLESESRQSRKEIKADIANLESSITKSLAGEIMASTRRVLERDRARLQSLLEVEAKNQTMKVLLESRSMSSAYLSTYTSAYYFNMLTILATQGRLLRRMYCFDEKTKGYANVARSSVISNSARA